MKSDTVLTLLETKAFVGGDNFVRGGFAAAMVEDPASEVGLVFRLIDWKFGRGEDRFEIEEHHTECMIRLGQGLRVS
jgi:hypothetical protein